MPAIPIRHDDEDVQKRTATFRRQHRKAADPLSINRRTRGQSADPELLSSFASALFEFIPGNRFPRFEQVLARPEEIAGGPIQLFTRDPMFLYSPILGNGHRLELHDPAFVRDPDGLAGDRLVEQAGHVCAGLCWR